MSEEILKRKNIKYIIKRKKNGTFAVGRWKKKRKRKRKSESIEPENP
jgi:hypothetical protein